MSGPFDPLTFFTAIEEFQDSGVQSPADRPIRLATIDAAFTGTGNPKLVFDGEATVTTKGYAYLGNPPPASARVAVAPVGSTDLILGVVNGAQGLTFKVCTSGTRPASPQTGDRIYETDTAYTRLWNGSAWAFQAGPEVSARYRTVTNSSLSVGDTILNWSTTTRTGDIAGTTSRITFNRAGWYSVRGQVRFVAATSGERFVAILLKNSGGTQVDVMHQNQVQGGYASASVGGPLWVPTAGHYAELDVYTANATSIEGGWNGHAFDAYFMRPAV